MLRWRKTFHRHVEVHSIERQSASCLTLMFSIDCDMTEVAASPMIARGSASEHASIPGNMTPSGKGRLPMTGGSGLMGNAALGHIPVAPSWTVSRPYLTLSHLFESKSTEPEEGKQKIGSFPTSMQELMVNEHLC